MLRSVVAVAIFILGLAVQAVGDTTPPVPLELQQVYAPLGYDTDDTVEVMLVVHLPDSCHKIAAIDSEVTKELQVKLAITAKKFEGNCHQGPLPISRVLSLGRLGRVGNYSVLDMASQRTVARIEVVKATESVHGTDQRLYPTLNDAFLIQREARNFLVLRGIYTDSCQAIDKVTFDATQKVLIAIPELKHPEGRDCVHDFIPFEEQFEVTTRLPTQDQFLLHVRGAGGSSLNKLTATIWVRK